MRKGVEQSPSPIPHYPNQHSISLSLYDKPHGPHPPTLTLHSFLFIYLVSKLGEALFSHLTLMTQMKEKTLFLPFIHTKLWATKREGRANSKILHLLLVVCFRKLGSMLSSPLLFLCELSLLVSQEFFFMNSAPWFPFVGGNHGALILHFIACIKIEKCFL